MRIYDVLRVLALGAAISVVLALQANANVLGLPTDAQGWTVFTPSSDSRIVYVSSSGNDSTGQYYTTAQVGSDPKHPIITVQPFLTYAAAYARTRSGYPDWVLFKQGETFDNTAFYANIRSGRSKTEPFLISDYGNTNVMPVINNRGTIGVYPTGLTAYFAITNLDFYNFHRNPNDPRHVPGDNGVSTVFIYSAGDITRYSIHDFMIEGCRFTYHNGCIIQGENTYNAGFYRNVVHNAYSLTVNRPQGFYSSYVNNLDFQENIFDHNGWYSTVASGGIGPADPQNHNVYLTNIKNSTIKNNISTRPSSMSFKFSSVHYPPLDDYAGIENLLIENNFILDSEIGLGIGGNDTTSHRFKNVNILGNVLSNMNVSMPTSRVIVWANDMQDWDGGSWTNNLLMNTDHENSFGYSMMGTYRNVVFDHNIVYNFKNASYGVLFDPIRNTKTGWTVSGCSWTNNIIYAPITSARTKVGAAGWNVRTGWTFSGNRYYSTGTPGTRFTYLGVNVSDDTYRTSTGDNFVWGIPAFNDPTRSIETYMQSLGQTGTLTAYIDKIRTFGRYNWPVEYMAPAVLPWIKAGFGLSSEPPPPNPVCDTNHLGLCLTESTCTAATGNWCQTEGAWVCQAGDCPVIGPAEYKLNQTQSGTIGFRLGTVVQH